VPQHNETETSSVVA